MTCWKSKEGSSRVGVTPRSPDIELLEVGRKIHEFT